MALNKDKVMDSARKLVEKNQLDKAVKEYLRVVEEDPRDIRVWLKLGEVYTKKGAKQEATDTYLKVGSFYESDGYSAKAVAVYGQILKLDPALPDAHLRLAEIYRADRKLPLAISHLEAAAQSYFQHGRAQEGLEVAKRIVELDPDNVAGRIKLAEMYSRAKQTDEAVREFTIACDQLRKLGRTDDFLKVAERLLWHQPDQPDLTRELADMYLQRRDPRRALQKLQVLFKQDPHHLETLAMLAMAFQGLDQKAKAVSVLKELGRLCIERRMPEEAEAAYRKIMRLAPDDPDARAFLQARPEPPPAIASPASARPASSPVMAPPSIAPPAVEPEFAQDLKSRESASYRISSAAGEAHAEQIAKLLEDADVYIRYKLYPKATAHLRRVLELDSDSVEARERLKDVFVAQGRAPEGLAELLYLADLVVATDPARAADYAREALALDPNNEAMNTFVRRHRLDALPGPSVADASQVGEVTDVSEAYRTAVQAIAAAGSPTPSVPPGRPAAPKYRVEEGLSEIDFFLEHNMLDDAQKAIARLQADFPNHPLVMEKADELAGAPIVEMVETNDAVEALARDSVNDGEELELEELELDPSEIDEIFDAPSAYVREELAATDIDSNYDLAMAYKEMGQFRDAIASFGKIVGSERGTQALVMMGICHRDLGQAGDALRNFKQALHGNVTEFERQSLYYELGVTCEMMNDPSEALYYYDMIVKRYGDFLDTTERAARLRR